MDVFNLAEIAKVAGVGDSTIRDWLGRAGQDSSTTSRRILKASIRPSRGQGVELLFSFFDATVAGVIGTLRRQGLGLEALEMVAQELYRIEKSWELVQPFMVVGKNRVWFTDAHEMFEKMGPDVVLLVMDVKRAERSFRSLVNKLHSAVKA